MVKNIKQLLKDIVGSKLHLNLSKNKNTSKYELLVLIMHAILVQDNFRCVGLKEDQHNEPKDTNINLPPGWNSNDSSFSFKYKHHQSSMTFIVKCIIIGSKLMIHAVAMEDDNYVASIEIKVDEYIDSNELSTFLDGFIGSDNENKDEDEVADALFKCFKDLKKLEQVIQDKISKVLVPLPGDEKKTDTSTTVQSSSSSTINPYLGTGSGSNNNNNNQPPSYTDDDYNDPLRIGPPRRPNYYDTPQPDHPFQIGNNDLYPQPNRPFDFNPSSGGMYIGPNHPSFGNPLPPRRGQGFPGGPNIPARFDPYGPFPTNPNPNRNNGNQGRGRGRGRGRGGIPGGEPDDDHMQPPGYEDENPFFF